MLTEQTSLATVSPPVNGKHVCIGACRRCRHSSASHESLEPAAATEKPPCQKLTRRRAWPVITLGIY